MESVQSSGDKSVLSGPQARGSKRTKANDHGECRQLMTPAFPGLCLPLPGQPFLTCVPPSSLPLASSPAFPRSHRSLCLTLPVPGSLSALPHPCPAPVTGHRLCVQGLISPAPPRDPLTLDSADPGGSGRRSEARGDGVGDILCSPGPCLSCCSSHPPPRHHLLGSGTHSLTLALGASPLPSLVPCPPSLAPPKLTTSL